MPRASVRQTHLTGTSINERLQNTANTTAPQTTMSIPHALQVEIECLAHPLEIYLPARIRNSCRQSNTVQKSKRPSSTAVRAPSKAILHSTNTLSRIKFSDRTVPAAKFKYGQLYQLNNHTKLQRSCAGHVSSTHARSTHVRRTSLTNMSNAALVHSTPANHLV